MSMPDGNMKKKYLIDIDGTICTQEKDYALSRPYPERIVYFNRLYDEGHTVIYFTARGSETKIDWRRLTLSQFKVWGVKYHGLCFGKPAADYYIDDRGKNIEDLAISIGAEKIIEKPWGREYWLKVTDNYAMKRLEIKSGENISKQYHEFKEETWHIVQGRGDALVGDKYILLKAGDTVHIPPMTIHQVRAKRDLVIIESSTCQLDDIVRIERVWSDVYS